MADRLPQHINQLGMNETKDGSQGKLKGMFDSQMSIGIPYIKCVYPCVNITVIHINVLTHEFTH